MPLFDFDHLRAVLSKLHLPVPDHPALDFRDYAPSEAGIEATESINGAVNYDLERILGFKAYGLTISEAGPGVVALAGVLEHFIELFPGDEALQLWPPAVLEAATKVTETAKDIPLQKLNLSGCRRLKRPAKGTDEDVAPAIAEARLQKKRKTVQKVTSVPDWVDVTEPESNTGRPYDRLARQLSVLCYDAADEDQSQQLRCLGSVNGCSYSWAYPRNRTRVLRHAASCIHIDSDLRQQASASLSNQTPSAVAEQLQATSASSANSSSSALTVPSPIFELASTSGRQQLKAAIDFDVIRFVCAAGLPPSCVDCPEFKTMIHHLNSRYTPVSSSTLSVNQIPAEAARVHEKSISILRTQRNLTLSFDGGDTLRHRSVYTFSSFRVATPERRVFLIRGEHVSTKSHTGDYIASIARQILDEVGRDRFAAVVTDSTANVVRIRHILAEETPTILNLSDPCHKISLLIKDICKLDEFMETICIIRRVLRFFGKSIHSCALLEERRKLLKILRGLQAIVDTHFGTVIIAAKSLLRCMPAIRELVAEEAIVIPEHNHLFMGSSPASIMFEMQLTVLIAVLDPLLRGLTCLELSFPTPSDVLLIFSATISRLEKHLRSGLHGISQPKTINNVRGASIKRFSQLINESPNDLYPASFYLDPYHRNSQLLRDIDPLSIKITLSASDEFSSHAPTVKMIRRIGRFLFDMLRKQWDHYPNGIVRSMYTSAMEAKEALRQQLLLYGAAVYPFSEKIGKDSSAYEWWKTLRQNPLSKLLAFFALKLFSITPNSMVDERTFSAFRWLNSAVRSRQDVSTIVQQTQIRQFYAWDEVKNAEKRTRIRYRDITNRRQSENTKSASDNSTGSENILPPTDNQFQTEYSETGDAWLDECDEDLLGVDSRLTEVNALIDLDAPEIEDCLSDKAPAGLKSKHTLFESGQATSKEVDKEMMEEDWDF